MDETGSAQWGTTIARSPEIPHFRQYSPRPSRLTDLLLEARHWGGRDYLVHGPTRVSFDGLCGAVSSGQGLLESRSIGRDTTVLLLASNSASWVVAFWSCISAGAVVALGNAWWSSEEVAHALQAIAPALVITDRHASAALPRSGQWDTLDVDTFHVATVSAIRAGAPPGRLAATGPEGDAALILFTAGTTGVPKAAVLSHRALIANVHSMLHLSKRLPHMLRPDYVGDVSLVTSPLFHIGGVQGLLLPLVYGGTVVFIEGRFSASQVLDLIEHEKVTIWGAIPTMASRVVDALAMGGRDVSSIKSISLGGAPVPPNLLARLRSSFHIEQRVSATYGMTEAGGTITVASGPVLADNPGTSGRPLPAVEVQIADPDATGAGEVWVKTPAEMTGYLSAAGEWPTTTDGWIRTGDLGYLANELLYLVGRSKEIIIRGGENISVTRVEGLLRTFPGIVDASVLGLPDPDLGESVAAVVVVAPTHSVKQDDLKSFCEQHLAYFEVPRSWFLTREPLPTNDAGKVDRQSMLRLFQP